MSAEPELEARHQPQASSPAQNDQSEDNEQAGTESGADPGQVSHGEPIGSEEQGKSTLGTGESNRQKTASEHPVSDGAFDEPFSPGGAEPGAQQAVTELERSDNEAEEEESKSGGAIFQRAQSIGGRHSSGAQQIITEWGRGDRKARAHPAQLPAGVEDGSDGLTIDSEDQYRGRVEAKTGAHSGKRNLAEDYIKGRNGGGLLRQNEGRNEQNARAHFRRREDSHPDKQSARVIPLTTVQRSPRPSKKPMSQTSEQDRQWLELKTMLPTASAAWWNVRINNEGFIIKLRWRETGGQNPTLTFPRLTGERFNTLNNSGYDKSKRTLREWIARHLHELTLNPAKRDKALIAAEKLGIDLSVHLVHSSIKREI